MRKRGLRLYLLRWTERVRSFFVLNGREIKRERERKVEGQKPKIEKRGGFLCTFTLCVRVYVYVCVCTGCITGSYLNPAPPILLRFENIPTTPSVCNLSTPFFSRIFFLNLFI